MRRSSALKRVAPWPDSEASPQAAIASRLGNLGREPNADEVPAQDAPMRVGARASLVGVVGHLLHGVVFLSLAIVLLVRLGSLYWFFSALMAGVALFSLYSGATGLLAYRRILRGVR
jgi:hypothetical protein